MNKLISVLKSNRFQTFVDAEGKKSCNQIKEQVNFIFGLLNMGLF